MRIKEEGINDYYYVGIAKIQEEFGCTIIHQNNYGNKELVFANLTSLAHIRDTLQSIFPKNQRNIILRVVLDPSDFRCVQIERPAATESYLDEAIHWKLVKELRENLDDCTLQYYQPAIDQSMLWVYIIANDTLKDYQKLASFFPSLQLQAIIPTEIALLHLLNTLTKSDPGRFLLIQEFPNFFMLMLTQHTRLEKISLIPKQNNTEATLGLQIKELIAKIEATLPRISKICLNISKEVDALIRPALQGETCLPFMMENVEVIKPSEWVQLASSVGAAL